MHDVTAGMETLSGWTGTGRRLLGAGLAALALLAGACTDGGGGTGASGRDPVDGGPSGTVELDDVTLVAALERFDSCEAFLEDVKAEALERVGPYGFGGSAPWYGPIADGGFARDEDMSAGAEATAPPMPGGDTGSSGGDGGVSATNVQEQGVDEPDLVKTDGELMALVTGQQLRLLDVSDPRQPVLRSTTPLAGWNAELLLDGDRLLVLQHVEPWAEPLATNVLGAPAPTTAAGDEAPGAGRIAPGWSGPARTTITLVDVGDPAAPRVQRTWTVDGSYLSARLVEGTARIVLRSDVASRLPFVYPSGPAAEEAAERANREVVAASTLGDWVPTLTVTDASSSVIDESPVAPCDELYRPSRFAGFGMLSVLTAELDGGGIDPDDGVGVLSTGETVYASPTSLYVATTQWVPEDGATSQSDVDIRPAPVEGTQRTDLHQFDTSGSGPARYLASGSVDGYLLNQFAMSEHGGHLRVAVTEGQWSEQSASSVVVLSRRDDRLTEVGRVGDLGRGERIYAVRFLGDTGYVVTFRQVDPLYVIDLSDPTAPRQLGELKIPGYSAYLHPVGEGLLLGVGQDATDEGRALGSQISLFDVSDPADPRRVATIQMGDGTNSEVEYDHRAFLVWQGLAVVPYMSYRWDTDEGESLWAGAIAVDLDAEAPGLTERGRITHTDQGDAGQVSPQSARWWDVNYGSQIRRSIVIDDTLLTVSARGLLASDLATLAPGAWLSLDG